MHPLKYKVVKQSFLECRDRRKGPHIVKNKENKTNIEQKCEEEWLIGLEEVEHIVLGWCNRVACCCLLAHCEQLWFPKQRVAVLTDAVQPEKVRFVVGALAVQVEEGGGTFGDVARQGDSDHRHQYKYQSQYQ